MEKMPQCRICLVENVRMNIVSDKDLQKLYETLTDIPFLTEDQRPMHVCFLCFAKLKQCCQLQRKCLEAEELFAQMMNEPNSSVNRGQLKFINGLIVTPVENISIVDVSHIESIAVKEELPAVCERLDDVDEPKVEHIKYELELELIENSHSDAKAIPAEQTKLHSKEDVPLIQIKTEIEEEQEASRKKRRASDTTRAAAVKKRNLQLRGKKLEDVITGIQKKNEESDSKVTQNTQSGSSKHLPNVQELTNATSRVNISLNLDSNCHSNIKKCNVTKRIRRHTGEKPYKCEECQRCFSRKVYLSRHIRAHTGKEPYKCEECQLCFSQKGVLTKHIRTHTGEPPYKCEECQLCFNQKVHLSNHIRAHSGIKPYKCEECLRCFSQKVHLTRHIRTHTGEKPYKCEECQLCFSLKTTLLSHIRTHTGEKPFKCEECHLCFSQRTTLLRHIRTHTGEKPYKCEECQLCFRCKQQLTRHIGTHTREKPFKCEECQYSFSHKSTYTKHIRRKHAGASVRYPPS